MTHFLRPEARQRVPTPRDGKAAAKWPRFSVGGFTPVPVSDVELDRRRWRDSGCRESHAPAMRTRWYHFVTLLVAAKIPWAHLRPSAARIIKDTTPTSRGSGEKAILRRRIRRRGKLVPREPLNWITRTESYRAPYNTRSFAAKLRGWGRKIPRGSRNPRRIHASRQKFLLSVNLPKYVTVFAALTFDVRLPEDS